MISQQFNLVPRVDVVIDVMLGRLNGHNLFKNLFMVFSADEMEAVLVALDRFGIADQALLRAETLSGIQQERVGIARALMQQPKMILADEPIALLDPVSAEVVTKSLRQVHERDGITVLCNLHTLDTARSYCERVIGMLYGRVVFDSSAHELTPQAARDIYGTEHLDEMLTSTSNA